MEDRQNRRAAWSERRGRAAAAAAMGLTEQQTLRHVGACGSQCGHAPRSLLFPPAAEWPEPHWGPAVLRPGFGEVRNSHTPRGGHAPNMHSASSDAEAEWEQEWTTLLTSASGAVRKTSRTFPRASGTVSGH